MTKAQVMTAAGPLLVPLPQVFFGGLGFWVLE